LIQVRARLPAAREDRHDIDEKPRPPMFTSLYACVTRTLHPLVRRGLVREMVALLMLKIVLLILMRTLFFAHPSAPHMRLPEKDVARTVLGDAARPDAIPGARHDQ
jgi:hypothetical protein